MSNLEDVLDRLAMQVSSTVAHPARCNCSGCRRSRRHAGGCGCGCGGTYSSAETTPRRSARPARRQTSLRSRGSQLPGWGGWTPAVSLRDIDAARTAAQRGQPVAANLRPFLTPGPQVYRISRAGIDRDRPLNIGMTKGQNSIAQRMTEHFRQPSRGDPNVHAAIRNLQPGQILVQAAILSRSDMHPRRARTYEGWLQDRERPLLYDPNSTTFDEAVSIRRSRHMGGYDAS